MLQLVYRHSCRAVPVDGAAHENIDHTEPGSVHRGRSCYYVSLLVPTTALVVETLLGASAEFQ